MTHGDQIEINNAESSLGVDREHATQLYPSQLGHRCAVFPVTPYILEINFYFRLFRWTESVEFVKLANIKISFVLAICFKVQRNLSIKSQFSQGLPIFQEKRIQSVKGSLSQIQEGTVRICTPLL